MMKSNGSFLPISAKITKRAQCSELLRMGYSNQGEGWGGGKRDPLELDCLVFIHLQQMSQGQRLLRITSYWVELSLIY